MKKFSHLQKGMACLLAAGLIAGSFPFSAYASQAENPESAAGAESQEQGVEPGQNQPQESEGADNAPGDTVPAQEPGQDAAPVQEPEQNAAPEQVTEPEQNGEPEQVAEPEASDPQSGDYSTGNFAVNWDNITKLGGGGEVSEWAIVEGDGGYYIYMVMGSQATGSISIAYDNNAQGYANGIRFSGTDGAVLDGWQQAIAGASAAVKVTGGTMYAELYIPESFFPDLNFTMTMGDGASSSSIPSSIIPDKYGNVPEQEEAVPVAQMDLPDTAAVGTYTGITIDGDFSDWNAVAKTDVNEGKGWNTVDQIAMVWDGDYIYLYFLAVGEDQGYAVVGNWNSVTGAGPHNNGQYVITTDLGRELLVQLSSDNGGSVAGIDGAMVAVNNKEWDKAPHMWEVAIPSSALPQYKNTISFGMYQVEPLIRDVANLQADDDSASKEFNGIVYDGLYGDWEYYPQGHTLIQYATSGTQENVVDGEGALYSANGKLYGHVVSNMAAHLAEGGGEFTSAVTIRLNGKYDFYPQYVAVAGDGTINYDPQLKNLPDGTYEFCIIDSQGWKTAMNTSQLAECNNGLYGRMMVTIGSSSDEMEFEMDIATLAAKFGMDASDVKTLAAQFGRIGQQWIQTAGTSTGAALGIVLCLAVAGGGTWFGVKRKKRRTLEGAVEA